ncbi:MAG: glycosyltransferase, partial [Clostridia bacterium]|nr:glycosyltransferase [Clostridia bacterium]
PLDPTGDFPTMTAPVLPLGRGYNRLTYYVGDLLWTHFTRHQLNSWRASMGLAPVKPFTFPYREINGQKVPTLYPISPSVVQKPSGWGEHMHLTGFWFLDEAQAWIPQPEILQFLDSGKKPLYIGFGSMVGGSFKKALQIVAESLEKTGQRAILSSGWGGLSQEDLPKNILKADFIPHSWLFERVAAVVHHGGAGTTAAGLRAGAPTIVVPFGGDQPFWGKRVYELGAGPAPIPRKKLSVERLCEAIDQAVHNESIGMSARLISSKIQAEDGTGEAVKRIESCRRV